MHAAPRTMSEYAAHLEKAGTRVFPGTSGTIWTTHHSGTLMRRPTCYVGPTSSAEVRKVLWHARAPAASYLLPPTSNRPANAWLYQCTDQNYSLTTLPSNMRRNVRRGLQELTIAPLESDAVLAHGAVAFCETRKRVGLNDGTPEEFRRRFTASSMLPEYVYFGAWRNGQLAAFVTIAEVDDWAEIEGGFSMDALRCYRPNEALVFTVLTRYLVERKFRVVGFGLSSIQADSKSDGLHRFKLKAGFEALPVHRAFVVHPLIRPLVNRLTLRGINFALRLKPTDHRLKLACGALDYMLGGAHLPGSDSQEEREG